MRAAASITTSIISIAIILLSCSRDRPDIMGEWEGRYGSREDSMNSKVKMRFEGNEVFFYEVNGNDIATWVMRGDSVEIIFKSNTVGMARLNGDKTFMSGKIFTSPGKGFHYFSATKKTKEGENRPGREEPSMVSGEWNGYYRYSKERQWVKFRIRFKGNEAFMYFRSRANIALCEMRGDSIILSFPLNVTIRGTVNRQRTSMKGKQFTPSEPGGEPGEFYATKKQ